MFSKREESLGHCDLQSSIGNSNLLLCYGSFRPLVLSDLPGSQLKVSPDTVLTRAWRFVVFMDWFLCSSYCFIYRSVKALEFELGLLIVSELR